MFFRASWTYSSFSSEKYTCVLLTDAAARRPSQPNPHAMSATGIGPAPPASVSTSRLMCSTITRAHNLYSRNLWKPYPLPSSYRRRTSSSAGPTLPWRSPRNVFVARKTSTAAGAGGAAAARGARGASMPPRVALPRTSYTVCLGHHSFTCSALRPLSLRFPVLPAREPWIAAFVCQPRRQGAPAVQVTFTTGAPAVAFRREAPLGWAGSAEKEPSHTMS